MKEGVKVQLLSPVEHTILNAEHQLGGHCGPNMLTDLGSSL